MPRVKPKSPDRETALVAELRGAISEANASPYQLALRAGLDESSVRRFLTRERSLSLDSGARLCDVLGLKVIRPRTPRAFGAKVGIASVLAAICEIELPEAPEGGGQIG